MSESTTSSVPEEAEYEVSPALRKRLQQLFEHAKQMMSKPKYDFDYAHSLLGECCRRDPANLVYVETMLDNLERKFGGKKKGSLLAGLAGRGAIKKAHAAKRWQDVIAEGIELLKGNPWDSATLRAMVDACEAMHYNEVGLRYMKNALDGSPGDLEVVRHGARYLGRVGQFDQAIALWHFIEEKTRGDEEANKMISQLTIDRQRRAQGLPTVTNRIDPADLDKVRRRKASLEAEQAGAKERAAPKIELTEKQKLLAEIDETPQRLEPHLRLVDLYCEEGKFHDAEQAFKRAFAAIGDAVELLEKREDVQIRRARHRLRQAEQQAAADPTPQKTELVESTRSELNRTELDIYAKRVERHPERVPLKYELAVRLKRVGNLAEAEKWFQEVADAEEKFVALASLGLGECLQAQKKYQDALQAYQKGLGNIESLTAEGQKLLLYRTGVLALGLKQYDIASQNLKRLVQMDPDFKDARQRLDKLKEIGHDG